MRFLYKIYILSIMRAQLREHVILTESDPQS